MRSALTRNLRTYLLITVIAVGSLVLIGRLIRPLQAQSDAGSALGVVVTDGQRLNVRGAPSINGEIVGKLAPGTEVEIVGESNDGLWYRIDIGLVEDAWVSVAFIELAPAGTSDVSAETGSSLDTVDATRESAANVGEAQPALATNEEPTEELIEEPAALVTSTEEGTFVLLPTLTPTPTPQHNADEEQAAGLASTAVTATVTSLPTSAAPTPVSTPQGNIQDEAQIEPIGSDGDEAAGLVDSETITTTVDAPTEASNDDAEEAQTISTQSAITSAVEAPVRSPVASIGTRATTQENDTVSDAQPANDTDAFDGSSVTPSPTPLPPVPTPVPTPSVPTAVTQPTRMNVRSGPSTNYAIVTSVPSGTALEIVALSPDGTWFQVRVPDQEPLAWVYAPLTDALGPVDTLQRVSQDEVPPEPTPEPAVAAASAAPPIVSAPPPAGAGFFGYGVQAHLLGGDLGRALSATSDLGFNWIKQQVEWKLFQPQPGAIGMGALGGIVSEAGNRGINVLFSVVNAPDWAREPGFDSSVGGPPADPQTYANFVGAMAGEFCGTALKAIEVWNEQNLHYEWGNRPLDPAEYMALLRPAYASIKAACPSMLVISGALTPAGSNPPFAIDDSLYLEGMYQNGLAGYADGIGAHPSGYNVPPSVRFEEACAIIQQTGNSFNGPCDTPHPSWSFRSTMERYRNIMVVYGDTGKRIWPTEFGWAAGGAFDPRYAYANDNSPDEQAAWTVEAFQMMKAWGWVGPAFLWNLNFRVVADGTEKAQWGIVRNDYSPFPVYDALKAMPK